MSDEERDNTILKMIHNLNPLFKSENSNKRLNDRNSFEEECESSAKRIKYVKTETVELEDSFTLAQGKTSTEFSFTVTPKSRPSMDMSFTASPKEARRLRFDLMQARTTIMNLENRIKHMHGLRKEMQVMFDNETKSLVKQRERDIKTIEELESQLLRVRKRESDLKEELNEKIHEFEDYKLEMERTIIEMESHTSQLLERLEDAEGAEQSQVLDLQREIKDLRIIYDAAQKDIESHKQLVAQLEKELCEKNSNDRDNETKDQALQKAQMKIKELEYTIESYEEWQQLAKTQSNKIGKFDEIDKENKSLKEEIKNLKEQVHNKLLLEEQVHDLSNRLNNYKDIDKKMTNMQLALTQNELFLEEWRTVARGICETNGSDSVLPRLLRAQIDRLQQQEITLTSAKVELESQLNSANFEAKAAKVELKKTQKLMADLQKTHQQTQSLSHRMQKKLLLISRERDSYRQQLDSYERDLTMTMAPGGSTIQFQSQKERIDSLEKLVDGYRDYIEKLENDLNTVQPLASAEIPVPIRSEQITRMQEQIEQLTAENERLMERKDRLEIQLEEILLAQDKTEDRVIHFAKNPLNECVAQHEAHVDKLKEEIDRLRKKIKCLEEGLEASRMGETSISSRDVEALKTELAKREQKIQKLKDCFKGSLKEFRDMVYMLFGYKIDRLGSSLYKLTSMYAEKSDDNICFQMNSEGELSVYETEFSATLEDKKELHLHHQKSIPVFLSAITMDLFCSRTNV